MTRPAEVLILRETLRQSIIADIVTFVMVVSIIGIGVWLRSEAMQWVGAVMLMVTIIGKSIALRGKGRLTIPEARARLDEIEREQSGEAAS